MGGKIYVCGGCVEFDQGFTSTVVVFDLQANTWIELASMSTARAGPSSAAMGSKLYVFGGSVHDGTTASASVEVYDPISNTWAQVSDLSSAREDCAAAAL